MKIVKNMIGKRKKSDITTNIISDDFNFIDKEDVDMDRLKR